MINTEMKTYKGMTASTNATLSTRTQSDPLLETSRRPPAMTLDPARDENVEHWNADTWLCDIFIIISNIEFWIERLSRIF